MSMLSSQLLTMSFKVSLKPGASIIKLKSTRHNRMLSLWHAAKETLREGCPWQTWVLGWRVPKYSVLSSWTGISMCLILIWGKILLEMMVSYYWCMPSNALTVLSILIYHRVIWLRLEHIEYWNLFVKMNLFNTLYFRTLRDKWKTLLGGNSLSISSLCFKKTVSFNI